MVRAKTTPRRVTPASKYTYRSRTPVASARRRLMFEAQGRVPYPMISGPTPRRTMARSRIGFAPGAGTSYANNVVNKWIEPNVLIPAKSLISESVLAIARQTTGNEINLRERDMINCLGF